MSRPPLKERARARPALLGRREQLDNTGDNGDPRPQTGAFPPRPARLPYETANFSSLIAAKSLTSPPTRFDA
jgi:hypothetical protein